MSATKLQSQPPAQQAWQPVVELTEMALMAQSLEELEKRVLPGIASMMQSPSVLLYIVDARLNIPRCFQYGLQAEAVPEIEHTCAEQFAHISSQSGWQPVSISASPSWKTTTDLTLYPLRTDDGCVGLMGLTAHEDASLTSLAPLQSLLRLLANAISRLVEHRKSERQLSHLNTYLTVSSMLAQSLGLHELLETVLYCCMETVSAEAASVLLLDDEKKSFSFYQVEGPAKPVLMAAILPVDQGIAGSILQTQQSEVINDVLNDPRFYQQIDSESGFQTKNMIAIPLVAGEEPVGVLEVLNKIDRDSFSEEEHLLLVSIAEEIAFAIRNAKVFEYVVNTYCKQRQGQMSCRGCKRPLGSWTPCIKYREASI
jgi:GAF domain-containing protein